YDGELEHLIPVCTDSKAGTFLECTKVGLMVLDVATGKWVDVLHLHDSLLGLGAALNLSLTFATTSEYNLTLPVTMRVADMNYDGYPDLITLLRNTETGQIMAAIFINHKDKQRESSENPFGRTFHLHWTSRLVVAADVILVSTFDIYDNG